MSQINYILRFLVFLALTYLFFLVVKPFIPSIILALSFTIIFYPFLKWFSSKTKIGKSKSAAITVILTILLIVLPLTLLAGMIGREAILFAKTLDIENLKENLESLSKIDFITQNIELEALKEKVIDMSESVGAYISGKSLSIASSIGNSIFQFFVFLLLYYYILKDSKKLTSDLEKLMPYTKKESSSLFKSFQEVSKAIFYGNLIVALFAGLIAYIGFVLFGFETPIIWALLASILSFIPTAGTLLIYISGIILLALTSGWLMGLGMLAYFILADWLLRENYLKSKFLEDKLDFHPIFIFFSLTGGVAAFGSLGLIYGPLIIAILGSLYKFQTSNQAQKEE